LVDFTLTDEQKDLRELAHSFAEKEIRRVAWEYDRDGTWPQEIVEKAFEVGLMNVHITEAYGGPGLDYLSGCLIEEELGWGCSGIGTSLMANGLACAPLLIGASEETKRKYLGMLTEEPRLASFCLTEPDAGSDVSGMKTRAVKTGDKYVISGSKCFITNGGHASWYMVYAKTDPDAGHRGITAFVVDRDAPGVSVDKKEDKLGQRASDTATISFDEVEVPAENMIGEENKGFKLAMMTLDRTRPGVSALAVGIARAAFEFASDYSKERIQFGVPIAMHQAVAFMIADMATKIEAARLLVWESAVLLDQGKRNTLVSSHAKRFAADTAMEVTVDAVQVYGGYGFIKEYPVEKLMRDAKIMQLYEGTSQIQRLVIAREILMPRQVEPAAEITETEVEVAERAAEQAPAAAEVA
jgi:acyl-CoA dehydrogenase